MCVLFLLYLVPIACNTNNDSSHIQFVEWLRVFVSNKIGEIYCHNRLV